jgi:hypothetical protein
LKSTTVQHRRWNGGWLFVLVLGIWRLSRAPGQRHHYDEGKHADKGAQMQFLGYIVQRTLQRMQLF